MGYVVLFAPPNFPIPFYLKAFIADGDRFRPVGLPRPERLLAPRFSFRGAWFIAQNMRRAGYQAEVQYVK